MQTVGVKEAAREQVELTEIDFAELFRQNYPRVYNYLRYRVHSLEDAEDLLGMVFEKAYTHRDQFDPAKASFSTWVFRIAQNTLANYYRTRERRSIWESEKDVAEDLASTEVLPEAQIIQQEKVAHLRQGLKQLSERDQEIISLKFAGRLNNKEIGQIMDLKEKTVSVVLLRAMRRLQKKVQEQSS